MEAAPGEGAELMGVGGWEGGCCPPVIPPGMPPGPPIGPSLWGFGVPERSSPEAGKLSNTVRKIKCLNIPKTVKQIKLYE